MLEEKTVSLIHDLDLVIRQSGKGSSKTDRLSLRLAQIIVRRELRAGDLLASEHDLAKRYALSRPNVRQALQRLAAAGLVEVRHGIGTAVNAEYRWNLFDSLVLSAFIESGNLSAFANELVELRKMVEVECAGLAASRISSHEINQLDIWLDKLASHIDDVETSAQADLAFHDIIVEASQNRFLKGIMRHLNYPLSEARRLTMMAGGSAGRRRALKSHQAIRDAIASNDADLAREEMRQHMKQLETDMRDAFLKIPV